MVTYLFTDRNGSHQQLCVISLSHVFYIFQHRNLLEKGFFCRHFHRSEGPLQKNFLQIKVEKDLKFLLAQITSNIPKSGAKQRRRPRVFARWAHCRIRISDTEVSEMVDTLIRPDDWQSPEAKLAGPPTSRRDYSLLEGHQDTHGTQVRKRVPT